MGTVSDNEENQIQSLVEQLYENEGLTDALTDEAATLVLQWGEQQLSNLAHLQLNQADLESAAHALQRALRVVNRLMQQRTELSDTEMIQHLLKLIEQVIVITSIAQKSTFQGIINDQET